MSEAIERPEHREGYKEVQIGPKTQHIPEDWEVIRLDNDEYVQRTMGGTPDTSVDEYWGGDIPWMRSGDIHQRYITDVEGRITEEGKSASRAEVIPEHSVLIGLNGQGKTKGTVATNEIQLTANQSVGAYIVNHEQLDYRYLYFSLDAKYPRLRALAGGGRSGLNLTLLGQVKIPYPPLPEQRRIADILSTVDEQIQQTDEIIEMTKDLKHGLRQDLVFGKGFADDYKSVRLGARNVEIPSGWEVETFSDVAAVEKGNTPKTSNPDYYGGDNVWVTPDDLSNMYDRGEKYISDSRRKITDAGLQSTSVNIVPSPSVMFTSRSYGIGKTAICTVPAATNQGIIAFHPSEQIGVEYLYYYLNQIMDYIIAISGVSNFPEVSLTDIRNLHVPVPSKDDQERIESVLQLVDERLVKEQDTKRRLQELKRGLMQDLLTGKVRVNAD
ncbi:restriction endonuclease subunit S [Halorubrum sp. AD140]|uniref:restriction endonuclease subunit S n=1 Tax=Halorubrum sp. AD140 TaxID=3050073 RepID=UPI002ACC94BB|nr:restriction endonuclease subunit S [Halorubrum sp. AD140]MDZ5810361.1 restriction endonuclease subunit S [Halorubrum sp. AD140]